MGQPPLPEFQVHAVHLTNVVLQQRHIPEYHIIISMEVFHDLSPAWRMLHSSTSSIRHDQTDEHCPSNHMSSDCLVLGSHSCTNTVTFCISLSLSHSKGRFSRTALGTFLAHPGHIAVGTAAVSDSWVRLELRLLCTFDVLCTRLEPSFQLLCTPGLGATRHLKLHQRIGRRAVFGQQVLCILLLLGNLFRLGRPGLRRFALTSLTAVRSESESAI